MYRKHHKKTLCDIGYVKELTQFNFDDANVIIDLKKQSQDIAIGINKDIGAGDQGMMFGFACNETDEYLPTSVVYAHKLTKRLSEIRKNGEVDFLRPDGKAQLTIEYDNDKIKRIDSVVISAQHSDNVSTDKVRENIY